MDRGLQARWLISIASTIGAWAAALVGLRHMGDHWTVQVLLTVAMLLLVGAFWKKNNEQRREKAKSALGYLRDAEGYIGTVNHALRSHEWKPSGHFQRLFVTAEPPYLEPGIAELKEWQEIDRHLRTIRERLRHEADMSERDFGLLHSTGNPAAFWESFIGAQTTTVHNLTHAASARMADLLD